MKRKYGLLLAITLLGAGVAFGVGYGVLAHRPAGRVLDEVVVTAPRPDRVVGEVEVTAPGPGLPVVEVRARREPGSVAARSLLGEILAN
ncbi:MAG: hypothetical protein R6X14_10255 [bacterium]